MNTLLTVLEEAGLAPVELGGKVLVLPHGGRVMGLYPQAGANALWINPAFASAASVRKLLADPGWINLGGDRTWISPEVETHVGDPARGMETYEVPKSVDPAAYAVTEQDARRVSLETRIRADFQRSAVTVDLRLTKTVSLLDSPPLDLPANVDWAGYTVQARLEADDLPAGVYPALWHIIQVPGGGRIVLPVRPQARPRAFIGDPHYVVEAGTIACDVGTAASFKFSLRADDCRGMLIYLHLAGDSPFMLVRTMRVAAADRYTDVPWDDLADTGHVEQVYVDDGALGGFGEIEYHSPALGKEGADMGCDENRVWAFAGSADALGLLFDRFVERASEGVD